jgi:aromatic ring-opening dioxygenase catalytic subunit (LigB family)
MNSPSPRMPTVYLPHGGGPWPFVELRGFMNPRERQSLADYLSGLAARLPERPRAMLVVSAHWEEAVPTVMTSAKPPLLYDYSGFPPEAYQLTWPAPGAPQLAARVRELLGGAGFRTAENAERGFDHGTFVPLKLAFPNADVPTLQLSLEHGLDPARHIAIGRALAPLRDEGVLVVGSGMSYHNLREFRSASAPAVADAFDAWLQRTALADAKTRDAELVRWAAAPLARDAHPREEHLLPLMVVAGAAGADRGSVAHSDTFGGARVSALHFDG